jgi:hypothetical protein
VPMNDCGIDKEKGEAERRRRMTGGILTAVLPCGMLLDWMEIWRSESIPLVYIFVLQLCKDLKSLEIVVRAIGYDNACKLLAFAESVQDCKPPWTRQMANDIAHILDRFHRRNHTWCLNNRPSVDPLQPSNQQFVGQKNTPACEQLNSWISGRPSSSLELGPGKFGVYWWALFTAKNQWLEASAAADRSRYQKGCRRHDPDKPRGSTDA